MVKKSDGPGAGGGPGGPVDRGGGDRPAKGRRRQPAVMASDGTRSRFLRGVITNDLVQRGIDFDDAYAISRAVRDRVGDRDEVTTSEIRDLVQEYLSRMFGTDVAGRPVATPIARVQVIYHGQRQPFSRGLLARSIRAAGLELDHAYRLVTELEADLRAEAKRELSSGEIARRVADLLERTEGADAARRYRLVRRIHRLPRPLVIYIGGASGTGKSTLALEIAPLLRIYRIIATDTIRQVMRMVFTPAILPGLHTSSFEVVPPHERATRIAGSPGDPEFARRVIAAYEEQSTRVCVGVRAVVERAIVENMSIVVEGVHLHPGQIPFPDLDGAAYQVFVILSTMNPETHRPRFLVRSRVGVRGAERYLENFPSIRLVHDHLIHQAEALDVPLLDTSDGDPQVERTMRFLTGEIERRFPQLARAEAVTPSARIPTLLLCIDGLADRPVRALGGRTPLQAAVTPVLDRLARAGRVGLADPVAPGVVPNTASGTLAVFGQYPLALKRGPIEAVGAGIALRPGDLALRGNLATLDEGGRIVDRRAGRIREGAEELAAALDRMALPGDTTGDVTVRVRVSTEHRLAIVLQGEGLSSAVRGTDPGEGAGVEPPLAPRPDDTGDESAVYTAGLLSQFHQEAMRILGNHPVNAARREKNLLPANVVLTRGPGRVHRLVPLEEAGFPLKIACVAGDRTILGLASLLGAETITSSRMTANLDTDLDAKFDAADEALDASDLVMVHVKGADIAAHDLRPEMKVAFLESVDTSLGRLLDKRPGALRVIVAADHATLSETGQHAADPVPVLISGTGIDPDDVQVFDEPSAGAGSMQRFPLQMLLGRLYDLG